VDANHCSLPTPSTMSITRIMSPPDSIVPIRVGRVLLVVCWLAVIYGMAAVVPHVPSVRGIAAWTSTAIFLATFTLVVQRPHSNPFILISALAAVMMQLLAPNNGAFVAAVAVIAVAGIRLDRRSGRIVAAVTGVGFLAASALSVHALSPSQMTSIVPALLFTYLGATAARRLQEEQRRTAELLDEVVAGRDAVIRAATLDERAHLAREMHDVLAHTLSALSIQLEGTRLLAEQQASDPAVVAGLERTARLAREGLGEARRAVGSLRGETPPGPDLLPQLAQEFEQDTATPCHLQFVGRAIDLGADARLALYRIAQEALTNVRKHADATRVDITLSYESNGMELVVENDGDPRSFPLPGGGYGISGMRERAEMLGGKLEAGSIPGGYRVRVWIPTQLNTVSAS
jgi:signal transduction histidine kinase